MSKDKEIEAIVGSKISWIMKWGTIIALAVFFTSYLEMYTYNYRYTRNMTAQVCKTDTNSITMQLCVVSREKSIYKELLCTDSIRIFRQGGTGKSDTFRITNVSKHDTTYHVKGTLQALGNSFNYHNSQKMDIVLYIDNRSLFNIVFFDIKFFN
jgi:hypothetical protein